MKIYLVGGAIRNFLLNLPIKDKDWVIVGGTKKMLLDKNFQQVGKDFPVFLHPKTHEEYALARRERKSGRGHTDFYIDSGHDVTLEEDLIRRDLTMNAIAQDQNGNYIDPFKGRKDIKSRLIRHVSKSFIEDPLRVLRTARFAADLTHLGFQIARETIDLMSIIVTKRELSYLTPNRIWNETEKAFKTSHPHVYFQVLHTCKALKFLFPEIYCLYEKKIFLSFNLFQRLRDNVFILTGLSKISVINEDIDIRFSYLCQFFSHNKTYLNSSKKFFNTHSAFLVKNLCKRFNIPSCIRDIAVLSAGFYNFLNTIHCQSSENIVKLFYKIDAWRKPERVIKLSCLSNFNSIHDTNPDIFCFQSGLFLTQSFSIIKNISIKLILKQGFQGREIKDELMRLRVKKLESWRINNLIRYLK